jgi:hypothetical protein
MKGPPNIRDLTLVSRDALLEGSLNKLDEFSNQLIWSVISKKSEKQEYKSGNGLGGGGGNGFGSGSGNGIGGGYGNGFGGGYGNGFGHGNGFGNGDGDGDGDGDGVRGELR